MGWRMVHENPSLLNRRAASLSYPHDAEAARRGALGFPELRSIPEMRERLGIRERLEVLHRLPVHDAAHGELDDLVRLGARHLGLLQDFRRTVSRRGVDVAASGPSRYTNRRYGNGRVQISSPSCSVAERPFPSHTSTLRPRARHWISPRHTGRIWFPSTKHPQMSVPPEIDDRHRSRLIA